MDNVAILFLDAEQAKGTIGAVAKVEVVVLVSGMEMWFVVFAFVG